MKKKILSKVASLGLAAVLTFGVTACTPSDSASSSGGGNADTGTTASFNSSNDFFAMSAASGVNFLNAENADKRAVRRKKINTNVQAPAEEPTARPDEFTAENVAEIKNTLVMFDSIVGGGVSSKFESCGEDDGEYSSYTYKMTVNFGGESAVMYYNETDVKASVEQPDDDDDDENIETEINCTLSGVLVSGEFIYNVDGVREEDQSADEREFKLEFTVKKTENDYVVFTYETESEAGENETSYECEIFENGVCIQETEIEIEEENGETEIKFELEKGGKTDGVEYKIKKRSENKFDIRREQNNKKSYILAEKNESGYKFTYSNGYSEVL